jgi:hypothetical protein
MSLIVKLKSKQRISLVNKLIIPSNLTQKIITWIKASCEEITKVIIKNDIIFDSNNDDFIIRVNGSVNPKKYIKIVNLDQESIHVLKEIEDQIENYSNVHKLAYFSDFINNQIYVTGTIDPDNIIIKIFISIDDDSINLMFKACKLSREKSKIENKIIHTRELLKTYEQKLKQVMFILENI